MAEVTAPCFLQISDLHFSHLKGGREVGADDAKLPKVYPWLSRGDGFLGHHNAALTALEDFYYELGGRDELEIIVTGDLTRNGHPEQFEMASQYLSSTLRNQIVSTGLSDPKWQDLAIAGNHDNWPGCDFPLGAAAAKIGSYIYKTPDIRTRILKNGAIVRFLRVDSDSEVHPLHPDRLFAIGKFDRELNVLSSRLGRRSKDEIRVLILHHSPSYIPEKILHEDNALGIDAKCLDLLRNFIAEHQVRVMLTGHIHEPLLGLYRADATNFTLEARCGTTTQIDAHPARWSVLDVERPLPPNSLIVHRVVEREYGLRWEASLHIRDRRGFSPLPSAVIGVDI